MPADTPPPHAAPTAPATCPGCHRSIRTKPTPDGPAFHRHKLDPLARYSDRCVNSGQPVADALTPDERSVYRRVTA